MAEMFPFVGLSLLYLSLSLSPFQNVKVEHEISVLNTYLTVIATFPRHRGAEKLEIHIYI